MAAKKKTQTRKKTGGKLPVSVDAMKKQLAQRRENKGSILGDATGDWLNVKGKKFQYKGAQLDTPVGIIVLAYAHENAYYDGTFDSDNPQPPACCAVGAVKADELIPLEQSPSIQAEACADCEHNEWGSGARGRSKACKNQYRVAFVPASEPQGDMAFVRISPTGIKAFEGYVRTAEMHASHVCAMTALMDFDEDEDYERVLLEPDEVIEDAETLQILIGRLDEAEERLLEPGYAFDTYQEPQSRAGARRQKKRASKKKVSVKKRSKLRR